MTPGVSAEPDRSRASRAGAVLRWALAAADRDPSTVVATDPPPSAAGLGDLTERAEYHRITPLLHAVARALGDLDPTVAAGLEASYHYAVRRHLFVLDDLAWVTGVLAELAPDVLVIKGPVLSATVYRRPDLRSYGDLDLVVPARSFARAVELLLAAGATFLEEDWASVRDRRLGEIALALPSGTVVDLHWHLIALGAVRDRFGVAMNEVFARAGAVTIDGAPYRTLARADAIVHLALHAVLCGGDRLGWFKDLEQAVRTDGPAGPIDWPDVRATATRWGALGALVAQLQRARRLVGPTVPDLTGDVPRAVARWAAAAVAADRIQPPERSTGLRTLPVVLSWSSAPTAGRSLVELARMGDRRVRRRHDPDRSGGGVLGGRTSSRTGAPTAPVAPTPSEWRAYLATIPT